MPGLPSRIARDCSLTCFSGVRVTPVDRFEHLTSGGGHGERSIAQFTRHAG